MIYLLLLGMTMTGAVASLFLKWASGFTSALSLLQDRNLYIGAALYIVSAVLNIYMLRFLDYAVALPLTSVTYVWTLLVSRCILKEKLTVRKIACIAGIALGSGIISLSP
jgi:drug/metabolite transporter (DMT)-like permease